MSQADPPPNLQRRVLGFLDALRPDGTVVGWARDASAPGTPLVIRLMRGMEVTAEAQANLPREDGNPGFRLVPPVWLTPVDFLEGRVRVRASLPGRPVATTLAMTPRMREVLEEQAGWEPTVALRAPRAAAEPPRAAAPKPERLPQPEPPRRSVAVPPRQPPSAVLAARFPPPPEPPPEPAPQPEPPAPEPVPEPLLPGPVPEPDPAPLHLAGPGPGPGPEPEREPEPPPTPMPEHPALRPLQALAARLDHAGIAVLHLLIPPRSAVLEAASGMAALEAEAAAFPQIARGWVPLRQAYAREPQPLALWRHDGRLLTVEGTLVAVRLLLAVLRLRAPDQAAALDRAEVLIARADPAVLPRRGIGEETGLSFLGIPMRETEPALGDDLFADQRAPEAAAAPDAGFEAWRTPGAPLPWRVIVLAEPGLGGSAGPAAFGWWLRRLAQECVISEALHQAPPEAVAEAAPDLVVTLAAF